MIIEIENGKISKPLKYRMEKRLTASTVHNKVATQMNVKETNRLRNAGSKLTKILCSVKLAIVALLFIGILSVVGTLVPQGGEVARYVELYGPLIAGIVSKAGLTNVFSSLWFLLPVGYLVSSMIVCSIRRLRNVLRAARKRSVLLEESKYELKPYHQVFSLSADAGLDIVRNGLREKVVEVLEKSRYRIADSVSSENTHYVSADKGIVGIWGPFLVHLSIIIIIIGGVWSAAASFSHFLDIEVGQSVDIPETPYRIGLSDFIIEYYEATDQPKEYISLLSVTENGRVIGEGELKVNAPLAIEGLHFYQMKYIPSVADVTIAVTRDNGEKIGEFRLPMVHGRYIEQIGLTVKPAEFAPDFAMTADKVAVSRTPNFNNPAVLLDIYSDKKLLGSKWVFFDPAGFHTSAEAGYIYELKDFTLKTFSGIRVVRDNAVPIIYAGFSILVLGAFLSCYVFHRRVWVMVKSSQGQIKLCVAGACNRNMLDFQREIDKCLREILPPTQEGLL